MSVQKSSVLFHGVFASMELHSFRVPDRGIDNTDEPLNHIFRNCSGRARRRCDVSESPDMIRTDNICPLCHHI